MCSGLLSYINLPSLVVCLFWNETVVKISDTKAFFTLKTQERQHILALYFLCFKDRAFWKEIA